MRAIVIDDEPKSRQVLMELIGLFCPDIEIIDQAGTIEKAISLIDTTKPDLVFFDILLQEGDSFEIIRRVKKVNFEMIFVTAFDEDSVKALKFSGAKVLLKPIQINDLIDAVHEIKVQSGKSFLSYQMADGVLKSKFKSIPVITPQGLVFKNTEEIVYAMQTQDGTRLYFLNGDSTNSERSISDLINLLDTRKFEVTTSIILNKKLVEQFDETALRIRLKSGETLLL